MKSELMMRIKLFNVSYASFYVMVTYTFGHDDQKFQTNIPSHFWSSWPEVALSILTIIRVVGEPYRERAGCEVSSVKYTTLGVSCFFRSPIT